jgi:dTDP-4-amino-4,6-dideoxygalactose transaminase
LHLSLLALGIGPGDEVIVPSFTFAATANAVALTGATPVFADIDLDFFTISPLSIQKLITKKTKAVLPVHLYGQPANMPQILQICKSNNLFVVEDAAQAHLAKINGKPVGTWGDVGCFSFYPTKNMTSGEGGMIVTRSPDLLKQVKLLRNQGMEIKYENEIVGFNNRMTDLNAAIGRVQLKKLRDWNKKRQTIADFYDKNLELVIKPKKVLDYEHVYHQYTIRIENDKRDTIAEELFKLGIGTGIYYPKPVHTLKAYGLDLDLPNTTQASRECLSLPIYPDLDVTNLSKIVNALNKLVDINYKN